MQPSNKATTDSFSRLGGKIEENRERIIKLEQHLSHFIEDFKRHDKEEAEDRAAITKQLRDIQKGMENITNDFSRYRGFIGGILLVFSGIGTILVYFKDSILAKIGA